MYRTVLGGRGSNDGFAMVTFKGLSIPEIAQTLLRRPFDVDFS
jgi:hypothetical protein